MASNFQHACYKDNLLNDISLNESDKRCTAPEITSEVCLHIEIFSAGILAEVSNANEMQYITLGKLTTLCLPDKFENPNLSFDGSVNIHVGSLQDLFSFVSLLAKATRKRGTRLIK